MLRHIGTYIFFVEFHSFFNSTELLWTILMLIVHKNLKSFFFTQNCLNCAVICTKYMYNNKHDAKLRLQSNNFRVYAGILKMPTRQHLFAKTNGAIYVCMYLLYEDTNTSKAPKLNDIPAVKNALYRRLPESILRFFH